MYSVYIVPASEDDTRPSITRRLFIPMNSTSPRPSVDIYFTPKPDCRRANSAASRSPSRNIILKGGREAARLKYARTTTLNSSGRRTGDRRTGTDVDRVNSWRKNLFERNERGERKS